MKYAWLICYCLSALCLPAWSLEYRVSGAGSDSADGTELAPWLTLQHAAKTVGPGATVRVAPGEYAGFYLTTSGRANAPIVFTAEPETIIVTPNPVTKRDGINLELASHVIVEGFAIRGMKRAGIRAVGTGANFASHVVIRNNIAEANGVWGIFTSFVNDLEVSANIASRSGSQHGIYVSNSGDRIIIRGNTVEGNQGCGIHVNGDAGMGGDGIIAHALIEQNVLADNGRAGGSAINCDGVQSSIIRNNLIYDSHASGISLFRIDGAAASSNNQILNNVIMIAADGRWCVNIQNASINNRVYGNLMLNSNRRGGSITISNDSREGFHSDHNIVVNRFLLGNARRPLSLAEWQARTGQDTHSLLGR